MSDPIDEAPLILSVRGPDLMLEQLRRVASALGTVHLESGTDVGSLLAAAFNNEVVASAATVVIHVGDDVGRVMYAVLDDSAALVALTSAPIVAPGPVVAIGAHGFSDRKSPDGSFPLSLVDDWGIDDVMAAAFDSVPTGVLPIALLIDLAVLDPVYEPQSRRTQPGGLDPRRLARAAYVSGRQSRISRVGVVASAPDASMSNFAHVVLSFCAGLVSR